MAVPGEKRRLRELLYRPAIHPGWLPPDPQPTIWARWGRRPRRIALRWWEW